jgi:hypothetical protein
VVIIVLPSGYFWPWGTMFLREPPGGPVGVRSTERSEARKVATRSEAKGHALTILFNSHNFFRRNRCY